MGSQLKKRRVSDDYVSDEGFVADAPSSKKSKTTSSRSKPSNASSSVAGGTDLEGNLYWEISGKKRVTLTEFKGRKLIQIREYYEKDGKDLPGKKV